MKTIELTQGKVALVDDDVFERLNKYNWYACKIGNTFYAKRRGKQINGKGHYEYLHRVIMSPPDNLVIDHLDHNGLNCQRSNLKICTQSENLWNYHFSDSPTSRKRSSKYFGVSAVKLMQNGRDYQYWLARIRHKGKAVYIGSFETEEEAALAYNAKCKELRGQFARLNLVATENS